jgi:hypothetical protein
MSVIDIQDICEKSERLHFRTTEKGWKWAESREEPEHICMCAIMERTVPYLTVVIPKPRPQLRIRARLPSDA